MLIGDIRNRRARSGSSREAGGVVDVPSREANPELDFRGWLQDQGKGEMNGPKVRAAGRIVLSRDAGKLRFVNIQDWTGNLQLLIGKAQVGEENWALAECFDLGDIIGVDGELRYTKTGELTIFAAKLHFLTKSVAPPPDKHAGLADPELRQRMRYLDLAYSEGVLDKFLQPPQVVRVDPQHAQPAGILRDRRADAARDRRRGRGPAIHHAPQHARPQAVSADRPGAAPQAAARRGHGAGL
jgi:lysyl-tRNA synthetase class 2